MPLSPIGENGVRLPDRKPVTATTTKNTRTPILSSVVVVVTAALSRMPPNSTTVASRTTIAAGTLMTPPSPGGAESASGMRKPSVDSKNELRYSPQPTATAATDTPYSSSRHQPQIQATSSPRVAYE
nr:hypothetical protein GCM10020241_47630 [Streptoalloteichus tenebrarius]